MDYIDLGLIDQTDKTKTSHKKATSKKKSKKINAEKKKDLLNSSEDLSKSKSSSHVKKIFLSSFVVALFLFGIYSFLPQIKNIWNSVSKGPALVMSFIKNEGSTQSLKQDNNVTNVLLLGIDKRSQVPYSYTDNLGQEIKNGFLADTIIVASYDHQDHSVTMLSLPRDLWVEIPAFNDLYKQSTKINATYSIGDMYGHEEGGLALTKEVVSNILNVPIHYSVRVDFEGFVKAIDILGGLDIEVENTFDDWRYPREGYENAPMDQRFIHLHFEEGLQHMDGETALRFARSRQGTNSEGSDFARAKRQQKVLVSTKEKLTNMDILSSLSSVSEMITLFGETIESNIETEEILLFYKLSKEIDLETVTTHVLNNGSSESSLLYHPPEEQFGGGWVLLPQGGNWDLVQEFVQEIFYEEGVAIEENQEEQEVLEEMEGEN